MLDAGCDLAGIFLILEEQEVHAVDPLLETYRYQFASFRALFLPLCAVFAQPLEAFRPAAPYDVIFV